jgi:hypothetical protein
LLRELSRGQFALFGAVGRRLPAPQGILRLRLPALRRPILPRLLALCLLQPSRLFTDLGLVSGRVALFHAIGFGLFALLGQLSLQPFALGPILCLGHALIDTIPGLRALLGAVGRRLLATLRIIGPRLNANLSLLRGQNLALFGVVGHRLPALRDILRLRLPALIVFGPGLRA